MGAASGGSMVLHAAILSCLAIGSYLHVGTLAEPTVHVPFVIIQPPPPAAAPPPPAGLAAVQRVPAARQRSIPVETPEVVQPQEAPGRIPEPEAGAGGDPSAAGREPGVPGGIPGGIPGGTVGGVPYGLLGGIPGGDSGGVLHGLRNDDGPVHLIGDVRPPIRTRFVKPEYPETARIARVQGRVVLEIVIDRAGAVEDVRILRSDPLFDRAAIEAVRRWEYQPALQAGRAVKVYLTVIVEFSLSAGP
ncbi:MAG TPA: energy transducer TonB [Candidatus Polarisedimenticolia bacterium]|nr:energy transducer TonB [Candidatus Polarisedimenticolia bacterium]